MTRNYKIITAKNPTDLESEVLKYLAQGWTVTGGLTSTSKLFAQAVIK